MKNYLLIAAVALTLSACHQKELDQSNHDKDSLTSVLNERDASLNEFISSFSDVERNLNDVAVKQHIITLDTDKPGELEATQKEHINEQITAINNLMDENHKKIAELNKKLKNSSGKNALLEKMIATLNDQLTQKGTELTELNERLNVLNAQVAQLQTSVVTLTADNTAQSQTIAAETAALHTAYYVEGKKHELQDAKIIDRKGGLLGIGKTSKLTGDFDSGKFTQIDYTQTTSIPVNSDMKIITSHPSDSYTLDKDGKDKGPVKSIVITNPEKFWSSSKYLVIEKD